MTSTEEKIKIMQAYVDGKEVEWAVRDAVLDKSWTKANDIWNFVAFDYRIKPEEKVHEMKKSIQVVEVENEGFMALMDEVITIFSLNYIYTGKLIGVNDTCVLLEDPSIVYETGDFNTKSWKDAQRLPNQIYVQMGCIESFGIVK